MKRKALHDGSWKDLPHHITPGTLFDIMWTPEDMDVMCSWSQQHEPILSLTPPTVTELYQYCGQQLFMGVYQLPSHSDYWHEEVPILAPCIFHQGLSRNRWQLLNAHLHISPEILSSRIRTNFQSHRIPSSQVDIDETRIRFAGRYGGIIYTPTKPAKRALECYSMADETRYLLDFIPRFKGSKLTPSAVIQQFTSLLPQPSKSYGTYIVVGDSRFGSVDIAEKLHSEGFLFILANGKARPSFLWKYGLHYNLRQGEEKAAKKGDLLATSTYSRKRVNLLSNAFDVGDSMNYKPQQVLNYYDATKHYVDDFNRHVAEYYYDHRHYKWTQAFFDGLLKMAVTNAFMIYRSVIRNPLSHREFIEALIKDLIQRKE